MYSSRVPWLASKGGESSSGLGAGGTLESSTSIASAGSVTPVGVMTVVVASGCGGGVEDSRARLGVGPVSEGACFLDWIAARTASRSANCWSLAVGVGAGFVEFGVVVGVVALGRV